MKNKVVSTLESKESKLIELKHLLRSERNKDVIDELEKEILICNEQIKLLVHLLDEDDIDSEIIENNIKGKYVIIDLRNMDYMKDVEGNMNFYDTKSDAQDTCGMYEFENAWIAKLIYNHIDTFNN